MTQEDKQLLLRDLSGRLPYGVKVHITNEWFYDKIEPYDRRLDCDVIKSIRANKYTVKPYLRPMSSMTEEEKDELYTAMDWYGEIDETGNVYTKGQEKVYRETFYEYTDWLNAHHFDYRGLIRMGLALEAPEGMYKTDVI